MNGKTMPCYIFLFFMSLYAFFSIGHFAGDGYQDYLTAESIVLDGNLTLMDRPDDVDQLAYKTKVGVRGANGELYSSRGSVGMALLLVPFYFAGHIVSFVARNVPHDYVTQLCVSFANPFFTALNCVLVFLLGKRMRFGDRTSVWISLLFGLSTMCPVYARTGFSEPAMMFFTIFAAYFIFRYKETCAFFDIMMSGMSLGLIAVVKFQGVVLLPAFFIYFIYCALEKKDFKRIAIHSLVFVLMPMCFVGSVMLLNKVIYGSFLSFGGYDAVEFTKRVAGSPHVIKGLYYYLFSTGKGFFLFNIPVVLGFLVFNKALAKRKKETIFIMALFLLNLIFYVKSFRRGSLFSWGPRYLMPSVPFLMLLAGVYIDEIKSAAGRIFLYICAGTGILISLPCMFVNQAKYYNFIVEKFKIDEYMINFIPDLSPMGGAWHMFLGAIGVISKHFTYSPDYRFIDPLTQSMEGYAYVDLWSVKIMELAPQYSWLVFMALFGLLVITVISFLKLCRIK
ncbi:MAG TPA: glycosyltransferase family 39 protein [Candidatus Omnitrophota bacterium]|nr:glycosyltransferase family 39 protein [Candidatus Omnitrophota bacterium]